jgi:hypothetical protein
LGQRLVSNAWWHRGYKIHRTIDDRSTNPITRRAVDWEPLEVSLVPISAEEVGTGFRQIAA